MTGNISDRKQKTRFHRFEKEIKKQGLDQSLRHFGLIPYFHVQVLLKHSRALLNPSRFEGWSSAVEEAKLYRVDCILSNLNVHREQLKDAFFFEVEDCEKLAEILLVVSARRNERTFRADNCGAREKFRKRERYFSEEFLRVMEQSISEFHASG